MRPVAAQRPHEPRAYIWTGAGGCNPPVMRKNTNPDGFSTGSGLGRSRMIVSASYRTDIPAFHAAWLLARLQAGFAEVKNPYGGAPYRVSLAAGEVTGFVLWTRNIKPLLPHLREVAERAPFMVQFTI